MFKKLKRKFILTATLSSLAVIVIAFSTIYIVVSHNVTSRPPVPFPKQETSSQSQDRLTPPSRTVENTEFEERLKDDRKKSLDTLLITLIITGVTIEGLIVLISFALAEKSIKPVREAYEMQKTFIANASHEIKTPLAVIQANLEAADIKGNKWLDNVAKKTEDLAALNNQLLTLAKMDATPKAEPATSTDKIEKIDLKTIVEEIANCYLPKINRKKATLKIISHATTKIKLNRADFSQILNILLDNSTKYCKTKIAIKIENEKIEIKNDGATISKDAMKHIFDRFYQTDKTSPGVGLGLSIAKQLADKNGWDLTATSTAKTTTFTLKLN